MKMKKVGAASLCISPFISVHCFYPFQMIIALGWLVGLSKDMHSLLNYIYFEKEE